MRDSGFLDYEVWIGTIFNGVWGLSVGRIALTRRVTPRVDSYSCCVCGFFWSTTGLVSCLLNGPIVW